MSLQQVSNACSVETLESRQFFAAGSVDPSFGGGSMVAIGFAAGSSVLNDLLVYPDGSVLAGGYAVPLVNDQPIDVPQLALAKYNFQGQLDTTFGIGGQVFGTPRGLKGALDLAMLEDGSFLALGSSASGYSTRGNLLVKFTPGGKVDNTFGVNGRVTLPISAATLQIGPGNVIYVAGQQEKDGAIVSYSPAGKLNTSFGLLGIVSTAEQFDVDVDDTFFFDSLAFDSRGRMYAAGSHRNSTNSTDDTTMLDVRAFRLDLTGAFDTTFGSEGYFSARDQLESLGQSLNPDSAAFGAIAIGAGELPIVVSSASDGQKTYALQLDDTGAANPRFADGGVSEMHVHPSRYPLTGSVLVQPDGKLLFAGESDRSGRNVFSVERLDADGQPDITYGDQGVAAVPYKKIAGEARAVALAPDGSIVTGGIVGSVESDGRFNDSRRFAVTRLFREEGPAGQLIPKTLRNSQAGFLFDIVWRDDDALSQLTIDGGDLRLFGADGIARRAKLSSITASSDGKVVFARYRLPAPDGTVFTNADNGLFLVKVLGSQVADTEGTFATRQTLGNVRVRIP